MREDRPSNFNVKDAAVTAVAAGTTAFLGTVETVAANKEELTRFARHTFNSEKGLAEKKFQDFLKTLSDEKFAEMFRLVDIGTSESAHQSVEKFRDLHRNRLTYAEVEQNIAKLRESGSEYVKEVVGKYDELFTRVKSLESAVEQAGKAPVAEFMPKGRQSLYIAGSAVAAALLTGGVIYFWKKAHTPETGVSADSSSHQGMLNEAQVNLSR